jgi:hypothetical protein
MLGPVTRSTHHRPFLSHCGRLRTDNLQAHFFKQLALPLVVWFLLLEERVVKVYFHAQLLRLVR